MSAPSAKTTMLKVSAGRSTFTRSPISFLPVSNGNPFIDPDTSTTKMYSRGGTSSVATACGGSAISRKKFSSRPWKRRSPAPIFRPASR